MAVKYTKATPVRLRRAIESKALVGVKFSSNFLSQDIPCAPYLTNLEMKNDYFSGTIKLLPRNEAQETIVDLMLTYFEGTNRGYLTEEDDSHSTFRLQLPDYTISVAESILVGVKTTTFVLEAPEEGTENDNSRQKVTLTFHEEEGLYTLSPYVNKVLTTSTLANLLPKIADATYGMTIINAFTTTPDAETTIMPEDSWVTSDDKGHIMSFYSKFNQHTIQLDGAQGKLYAGPSGVMYLDIDLASKGTITRVTIA